MSEESVSPLPVAATPAAFPAAPLTTVDPLLAALAAAAPVAEGRPRWSAAARIVGRVGGGAIERATVLLLAQGVLAGLKRLAIVTGLMEP